MKVRVFLCGLILATGIWVPALMAQSAGATGSALNTQESFAPGSLTGETTQGLFGTDVDSYLDVNDFADVEFSNVFGFIGASVSDGSFSGGIAKNLGGLYLGLFYDGKFWEGTNTTSSVDGKRTDSSTTDNSDFDNTFGLLVGSESFGGIKLTLDFNIGGSREKTDLAGKDRVDTTRTGDWFLDLVWGKNFAMGDGTLKPEIEVGFQFDTNYTKTKYDGKTVKVITIDPTNGPTDGVSVFTFGIAADYVAAPNEGSESALSIAYDLGIGIHNKSKSDVSGFVAEKWEGSDVVNRLALGYSKTFNLAERFSVGYGFDVGLGLASRRAWMNTTGIVYDKDLVAKTTIFTVDPAVKAGFVYQFATKPFSFNGGFTINDVILGYQYVNVTTKKDANANLKETKTGIHSFKKSSVGFGLGLQFTPIESFMLDMELSSAGIDDFNATVNLATWEFALLASIKL